MSTPLYYRDHLMDRYRLILDWVPDGTGRILDIGCGNGVFTQWLARKARAVYGTDHNARQIEYGRREFPGVTFVAAEGERLPFDDAFFDVVVMSEVIEHTADDRQALGEALRVLAPGGRLILTTPNGGPLRFLDGDNLVNAFVMALSRLGIPKGGRHADGRRRTFYEGFAYEWHRHYRRAEIVALLGGAAAIERVYYGGTCVWPLSYLAEKVAEVFLKRPIVTTRHALLRRIRALDFRCSWGPWSYNLCLALRKPAAAGLLDP